MKAPLIGIVMGSASDYETLTFAEEILDDFNVPYEIAVVSAHRTPKLMYEYASSAAARGLAVIIAGAGGAAHLPGMLSSLTTLPVLGVPIESKALKGLDSLLSIVQMPAGIPTATFAIGTAGATNAALFAIQILALTNPSLKKRLSQFREEKAQLALAGNQTVQKRIKGRSAVHGKAQQPRSGETLNGALKKSSAGEVRRGKGGEGPSVAKRLSDAKQVTKKAGGAPAKKGRRKS